MFRYFRVVALLGARVARGLVPSLKAGGWDKRTVIALNEAVAVGDIFQTDAHAVYRARRGLAFCVRLGRLRQEIWEPWRAPGTTPRLGAPPGTRIGG
jgi:hypothetical protein